MSEGAEMTLVHDEVDLAEEINEKHDKLGGFARMSIELAIEIGGLLERQKESMDHGQWLPWCGENLKFGQSSAKKYMALWRDRGKTPLGGDLGINEAYKRLKAAEKKAAAVAPRETPKVDGVHSDINEIIQTGTRFGCIYADPPWRYDNQSTRASTDNHYGTMTVDEIAAMPISELAADKALLHLWVTNAFLFDALKIIEAWGFEFRSSFVWVKPQMGIGNYWRNSHEIMLTARRGGQTALSKSEMSWIECGRGRHSAKPEQVRESVMRLSPGPYLELFGRRKVEGWTVFGNQVETQLV